jgi:hypothetical protein
LETDGCVGFEWRCCREDDDFDADSDSHEVEGVQHCYIVGGCQDGIGAYGDVYHDLRVLRLESSSR